MKTQNYKIEVVKKVDKELQETWEALWEKAENANMYNSYPWFHTCLETGKIENYKVYLCYKNNNLVAILPLQQYRCFGIKVFGSFDKEHLVDTPFLIESYDKEIVKPFFEEILQKENIFLQKLDDKATKVVHEVFPNLFFTLMSVNPLLNLENDPFAHMSPSTLGQIKRIIHKNEDKLVFKTYRTNLPEHLKTIFALQNNSSKKARAMDIFADEKNRVYYSNLITYCKQFVCINILYFDDKPIVYEIGAMYHNHYAGDQISYHNDYKKLSPGRLLTFYLLSHLKQEKITELDMGGGISSYKMSVAGNYRLLYNMYYSPNSIVMFWWKVINKARRVKQILFPKKFTRDHEFLFKTL